MNSFTLIPHSVFIAQRDLLVLGVFYFYFLFFFRVRLSPMIHIEDEFSSVQQHSLQDLGALQSFHAFFTALMIV